MDPEKKPARLASESVAGGEENTKEFGKVIDVLHSKRKLSSLRSYQGDMAEFIRDKNQSTISITLKEKERKEERKKEEELVQAPKKAKALGGGFKTNLTSLTLSLVLLAGGIVAVLYIIQFVGDDSPANVVTATKIIPYNNEVILANQNSKNIGEEFAKLRVENGTNIVKISDSNGEVLQDAGNFLEFLDITLPGTLARTLGDEYVVGVISQNGEKSNFLVIKINDFGRAFSGMLEWEKTMEEDLAFFNVEIAPVAPTDTMISTTTSAIATSTSTTTKVVSLQPPTVKDIFNWKDLIIKNKDTRGLVNQKNQAKIAYTFLDKNTILITDSLGAIGDMSGAFASRSVAR